MIKLSTNDIRESILNDNLVIPVKQVMSRKWTLFGLCVYERRVFYTDQIRCDKKEVKGFK